MNFESVRNFAVEFAYGGPGIAGKAGNIVGRSFRVTMKLLMLLAFSGVLVWFGMAYQYLEDNTVIRKNAIAEWAGNDVDRAVQVKAYEDGCVTHVDVKPSPNPNEIRKYFGIYECAEYHASKELSDVIVEADKVLTFSLDF